MVCDSQYFHLHFGLMSWTTWIHYWCYSVLVFSHFPNKSHMEFLFRIMTLLSIEDNRLLWFKPTPIWITITICMYIGRHIFEQASDRNTDLDRVEIHPGRRQQVRVSSFEVNIFELSLSDFLVLDVVPTPTDNNCGIPRPVRLVSVGL